MFVNHTSFTSTSAFVNLFVFCYNRKHIFIDWLLQVLVFIHLVHSVNVILLFPHCSKSAKIVIQNYKATSIDISCLLNYHNNAISNGMILLFDFSFQKQPW